MTAMYVWGRSRLVAAALSLVGATTAATMSTGPAASWDQPRYDAAQTGFNPIEATLSAANVAQVKMLASGQLDNTYAMGTPVVSGGVAYVEDYSLNGPFARLDAFSTGCAGGICRLLWTAPVARYGGATPTVADGMVFASGDNGQRVSNPRMYVFPVRCRTDGGVCRPLWHADLPGDGAGGRGGYLDISPTVSGGVVYVESGPAFQGASLFAFPESCPGPPDHACSPWWRGPVDVGADGNVAVAGGYAYVSDYYGYVFAFHTRCRSASHVCRAAWFGYTNSLGPSGVAVADGLLFVGSQEVPGKLYAFPADGCGVRGGCQPVWVGITGGNVRSDPAVAYGLVMVASDDGYLYAFPESCSGTCNPQWKAAYGGTDSRPASPSIANGVVYVTTTTAPPLAIRAFAIHCATGGAVCHPLWSGTAAGNQFEFGGVTVAGGRLYATGGPVNGPARMYVFGLGSPASGQFTPPIGPALERPPPSINPKLPHLRAPGQ